jgi:hypothetical protein
MHWSWSAMSSSTPVNSVRRMEELQTVHSNIQIRCSTTIIVYPEVLRWPLPSLITQFRANHVVLPFYLHRIKAIDSHLCLRCRGPDTVSHYFMTCPRYIKERATLRKSIKKRPMSLYTIRGPQGHRLHP